MKKLIVLGAVAALAIAMACGGGDNAQSSGAQREQHSDGRQPRTRRVHSQGDRARTGVAGKRRDARCGGGCAGSEGQRGQCEVRAGRSLRLSVPVAEGQHGHRREPDLGTAVGAERGARPQDDLRLACARRAGQRRSAPGPTPWTFITPDQPEGYIHGGELYDPLVNGKTIGQVVGSVTFIPGQGVRINDLGSYIQYPLHADRDRRRVLGPGHQHATNTEGGKTKVMAMAQGLLGHHDQRSPVHDREARRSCRRGGVARHHQHRSDRHGRRGARASSSSTPSHTYLWKAKWGGNHFNLEIIRTAVRTETPSTTSARATAASTTQPALRVHRRTGGPRRPR